ncbi:MULTISPECIES: viral A-type inclusion protein [Spirosoma]|uniref:Viral A-type inclusion protein n=1 Tax=Spirosoma sordidisoli TaxID=2502893 RepID=A0A4Q2UL68_9BACT|nr:MULTISPECIES: viral A-type inclusion protein [Spirosoma]RYC70273.1 viral A-type inclusion protein [Spirosoma sordidisoli]
MHNRVVLLTGLLTATLFLGSCQSNDDAVREAENEVFAIHDEVMPKTSDILGLKKQLNQRLTAIDSLGEAGSPAATLRADEDREQLMRLRKNLSDADSSMMSWMNHYNGDTLTTLSSEEALRYLAEQKDQINEVKTRVNSSIEQARSFLGKN